MNAYDQQIPRLMELFAGSESAHGEFRLSGTKSERGKTEGAAKTIKVPPTVEHWHQHLEGKLGLGVIPVDSDGKCWFAVIDVDQYDIAPEEIEARVKKHGYPFTICKSKSGGWHLYVFFSEPADAKKVIDKLKQMIPSLGVKPDTEVFPKQAKSEEAAPGNWINMPYYDSERTTRYAIAEGQVLSLDDFLNAAESARISEQEFLELAIPDVEIFKVETPSAETGPVYTSALGQGARNTGLVSRLGYLRAMGMEDEELVQQAHELNREICNPPLPEEEVRQIIKSVLNYPQGPKHCTDTGNAGRLVEAHGEDLRYIYEFRKWIYWNGTRWVFDEDGEIMRRAKDTALSIYHEAAQERDDGKRKSLSTWAGKSESRDRLKAMVELSQDQLPLSANQLDQNLGLLGVANGVINLRTGGLQEPRREDFVSKCTFVNYNQAAECPGWLSFLNRIMNGDQDMIDYLQRAVGYTLTGDTGEQCMFLLYGTGANGKSVFQRILLALLGDYGSQTRPETLMVKRDGNIPNDIARLRGARLVSTSETEEGQRLAEATVKQLTGSDVVTARFLHQEFFDFVPQFKIWLSANHKPVIRGDDAAIWRRIHLVPFAVTIPPEDRDKRLGTKLQAELPGILRWALAGCEAWQGQGLDPPAKVQAATESYRNESDVLRTWINETCVVGEDKFCGATDLYTAYKGWAEENIGWTFSQTKFGRRLTDMGYQKDKGQRVVYRGIGLLVHEDAGF